MARGDNESDDGKSGLGDAFARFDFSAANRLRLVLVVENWITSNALETIDDAERDGKGRSKYLKTKRQKGIPPEQSNLLTIKSRRIVLFNLFALRKLKAI